MVLIVKHGNSYRLGTRKQKIADTKKLGLCLFTDTESARIWTLIGTCRLISVLFLHDLDLSWGMVCAEYVGEWQLWWANLGTHFPEGWVFIRMCFEWFKIDSSPGKDKIAGLFHMLKLGLYVLSGRRNWGDVLQWAATDWSMILKWEFHETETVSWTAPWLGF